MHTFSCHKQQHTRTMATSSTHSSSSSTQTHVSTQRPCPLGSAAGLTKRNGELLAVAWPQKQKGYGAKPAFSDDTTTKHFGKVRAAADSTCEHKVLMAYSPHAPRNRPKSMLTNIVGRRYGPHPTSSEAYKGQSQVSFHDASDPESTRPWKTTNEVFQASARVTDVVGLANAGISSDIARRMHRVQGVNRH